MFVVFFAHWHAIENNLWENECINIPVFVRIMLSHNKNMQLCFERFDRFKGCFQLCPMDLDNNKSGNMPKIYTCSIELSVMEWNLLHLQGRYMKNRKKTFCQHQYAEYWQKIWVYFHFIFCPKSIGSISSKSRHPF